MAVRKPTVMISGQLQDLPSVDTLSTGVGSVVVTEVELDFGSISARSKTFTVTDAAVASTSKILMVQSAKTPTGKSGGEAAFDVLICVCLPATGSMKVEAFAVSGPVSGKFKFNYMIG